MKIGIIGNGVVGRATAFAWKNHCDEVRVHDALSQRSTRDLRDALDCDLVFVCLPEAPLDSFFKHIRFDILGTIPEGGWCSRNFVIKSTCPVGTTRKLAEKYGLTNVCHSPEFLTERTALWDACNPSRVLIGVPDFGGMSSNATTGLLEASCFARFPGVPIFVMKSDESEFVKLACNALYATKVSLFNELRTYCDASKLNWDRIIRAIMADGWTGNSHTQVPGPDGQHGFGGRCLPKDLDHLRAAFKQADLQSVIMDAVKFRNENIDRRQS